MESIRKTEPSSWLPEIEAIENDSQRAYLKRMAIETVLSYVSRTMSTLKIDFKDKKDHTWDYLLNVRPNKDMSAAVFWEKFYCKMLYENEVLVIFTEDNQMLIADDYNRVEYAVYEDVFNSVVIKDYMFDRSFRMSEVIFLEYNNEKLEDLINGLFKDYGELFGRMIEVNLRNNQIRGKVKVDMSQAFAKDDDGKTKQSKLQDYINKMFNSFSKNSVAIIPEMKGFDYEDLGGNKGSSSQTIEELTKLKKSLTDEVANIIGVPNALIYGEKLELGSNTEVFRQSCTNGLTNKLISELNGKILTKEEYKNGERVEVKGVLPKDPFEYAVQIDKIISSSFFTPNQALKHFGFKESTDPKMDKHYMTKNYEEALKGGEE